MDSVKRDEFQTRLVELCLRSGVTGFPRKQRDRHILLKGVALTMDRARGYTEAEVNDLLAFWLSDVGRSVHFDHVSLRRLLVDEGYLHRDGAGSEYRVQPAGSGELGFDTDVENLDVYRLIGLGMKAARERKHRYSERA